MKIKLLYILYATLVLVGCNTTVDENKEKPTVNFDSLVLTPPMGWSSWDCLGMQSTEKDIKAVADYMAEHLKEYGWKIVNIDGGWYHPLELQTVNSNMKNPPQNMDKYGRLMPDTVKFPSAKGGVGLKTLAEYVHSKGLKLGIHAMRGIPWNAVVKNTAIKGTSYHAADIVNHKDTCSWSQIMKGVDMEKAGSQEYYNSIFELYAEWGVDYTKVDDVSVPYRLPEIEGVHKAILNSKAPIILSLSPGPTPINQWTHAAKNAHLWRISKDFWDNWKLLKGQFNICNKWDSIYTPGHWPDADMLPIGKLRKNGGDDFIALQLESSLDKISNEYSRFTDLEKYTLMTLWCIFRSPLMVGGYLPENDSVTYKILTNEEVIAVNQKSQNNHEIRNEKGIIIWIADQSETNAKYVALFNTNDGKPIKISISWKEIGMQGELNVRNLWIKKNLGKFKDGFSANIEAHGCLLIQIK